MPQFCNSLDSYRNILHILYSYKYKINQNIKRFAEYDYVCRKLGCQEGRSAKSWVDYSLFGHQIVCHEVKGYNANSIHNAVDGDPVPVPHFGMALTTDQFHSLAKKVQSEGVEFVLEPHLRFKGEKPCWCREKLGHLKSLLLTCAMSNQAAPLTQASLPVSWSSVLHCVSCIACHSCWHLERILLEYTEIYIARSP